MSILKRIQEKDPTAKAQFTLLASGVITGLIALVWMTTLPARIGNTISLDGKDHPEEQNEGGLGSIIGEAKNQLGSLSEWKEQLDEQVEPAPDTALGSLMDEVPTETTPSSAVEVPPVSTTTPSVSVETPVATTTPDVVPEVPAPPPKMILIGTSTNQSAQ